MQNVLPSAVSSPWGTPNHEMRRALGRISTLLDAHPEFPDWISTDVDRGRRSRRGRAGLPCEVILRCGILKRLWQVDYRDLEFALLDSASAKQFARVNPLRSPKESVRGWREEALHGRIWADSEGVGHGTRFTFTVPVAEETRPPQGLGPGRVAHGLGRDAEDRHSGGRRRPTDAAVRARCTRGGGLRRGRDRRPGGGAPPRPDAQARVGRPGPAAARDRWHRAGGGGSRAGRSARHLHLRLRQGRDDRPGTWMRARPTTSSSPSPRRNWRRGCAPPCAVWLDQSPSCSGN